MASGVLGPQEFSWGESVRVLAAAPAEFFPGTTGSICGVRIADSPEQADKVGVEVGERVYIVEFGDGSSCEVPERWLALGFDSARERCLLQRMEECVENARRDPQALRSAVDSLLVLRDSLETGDRPWFDKLTQEIATLESASVASQTQKQSMGATYPELIRRTLDEVVSLIRTHPQARS
jgi:hypothetical protein